MSKHTKGPWKYEVEKGGNRDGEFRAPIYVIKSETSYVCSLFVNGDEREANAHLIAAAPDLYEALKFARAYIGEEEHITDLLDAAIAKAEGVLDPIVPKQGNGSEVESLSR